MAGEEFNFVMTGRVNRLLFFRKDKGDEIRIGFDPAHLHDIAPDRHRYCPSPGRFGRTSVCSVEPGFCWALGSLWTKTRQPFEEEADSVWVATIPSFWS